MRIILPIILLAVAVLGSCSKQQNIDAAAARKWSETADAQLRKKAAVYAYQRADASWVYISTAKLTETAKGAVLDAVDVLDSGYLVYPGGKQVPTINEAIKAVDTMPRGMGGRDGKPSQP